MKDSKIATIPSKNVAPRRMLTPLSHNTCDNILNVIRNLPLLVNRVSMLRTSFFYVFSAYLYGGAAEGICMDKKKQKQKTNK